MYSKFLYLLRESVRGLFHNKFMTLTVIGNIGLSLFFVGCFLIALLNLNRLIESAEERITFEVFLEDEHADIGILRTEILRTEGVLEAEFVSKKQALEIFKNEVGSEILTAVEGNPLPASFIVKIDRNYRTTDRLNMVREGLKRIPFVYEVSSIQDWVPRLHKIRNVFLTLSSLSVLIFSCAIFFMVSSTIRVTYLARQNLVQVLSLIGASESFIRIPFVIEGMLKGFFGGVISYLLLLIAVAFAQRFFPEIKVFGKVFVFQAVTGVVLGMIASFKSVKTSEK
jgi:cell division transport system permease protein